MQKLQNDKEGSRVKVFDTKWQNISSKGIRQRILPLRPLFFFFFKGQVSFCPLRSAGHMKQRWTLIWDSKVIDFTKLPPDFN